MADPKNDPKPLPVPKAHRIEVLERRLQSPRGASAPVITLTIPGMVPRWFNAGLSADRIWRAKQDGWEPVTPAMLADKDQIGGFGTSPDGYVTRGERHQEVLMYQPKEWRDKIQMAKTKQNNRDLNTRVPVLEAAGKQLGDQAASLMEGQARIVGGVSDNFERIAVTPVE